MLILQEFMEILLYFSRELIIFYKLFVVNILKWYAWILLPLFRYLTYIQEM